VELTAPTLGTAPGSTSGRTTIPFRFEGWGMALPTERITNAVLETRMETSDSWIVDRTGISERRMAAPGQTTAMLAIDAGRQAIERSGVDPADIDLLIVATTTPDTACPATAARVQHALGTAGAAFDLNAACAGFVHALHVGAATLASAGLRHVLVIPRHRRRAPHRLRRTDRPRHRHPLRRRGRGAADRRPSVRPARRHRRRRVAVGHPERRPRR
jgi:hypothetical protein